MTGSIGWQLDHAPSGNGIRRAAAVFHNHPQGTLTASDGIVLAGLLFNNTSTSQLFISATNLVNEGILTVGELGLMSLKGTNVNLKRTRHVCGTNISCKLRLRYILYNITRILEYRSQYKREQFFYLVSGQQQLLRYFVF